MLEGQALQLLCILLVEPCGYYVTWSKEQARKVASCRVQVPGGQCQRAPCRLRRKPSHLAAHQDSTGLQACPGAHLPRGVWEPWGKTLFCRIPPYKHPSHVGSKDSSGRVYGRSRKIPNLGLPSPCQLRALKTGPSSPTPIPSLLPAL